MMQQQGHHGGQHLVNEKGGFDKHVQNLRGTMFYVCQVSNVNIL